VVVSRLGAEPSHRESRSQGHQQRRGKSDKAGELGLPFLREQPIAQSLVHGPQVFGRLALKYWAPVM